MDHHSEKSALTQVNTCRIPIFSPTRRPQTVTSFYVETSWGHATITGKLGQQHRDLLDAAMMVSEYREWTGDEDRFHLHLKVDPAKLRSVMSIGGDANYLQIQKLFEDMRVARVDMHINASDRNMVGGIISEVEDAKCEAPTTRAGAFGSENRRYWRISFSSGWSRLIKDDVEMRYPLARVMSLQFGFSQAVARFCLSHSSVNQTIDSLVVTLNAGGRVRDRKGELLKDEAGLIKLGILVDSTLVKSNKARPYTR